METFDHYEKLMPLAPEVFGREALSTSRDRLVFGLSVARLSGSPEAGLKALARSRDTVERYRQRALNPQDPYSHMLKFFFDALPKAAADGLRDRLSANQFGPHPGAVVTEIIDEFEDRTPTGKRKRRIKSQVFSSGPDHTAGLLSAIHSGINRIAEKQAQFDMSGSVDVEEEEETPTPSQAETEPSNENGVVSPTAPEPRMPETDHTYSLPESGLGLKRRPSPFDKHGFR